MCWLRSLCGQEGLHSPFWKAKTLSLCWHVKTMTVQSTSPPAMRLKQASLLFALLSLQIREPPANQAQLKSHWSEWHNYTSPAKSQGWTPPVSSVNMEKGVAYVSAAMQFLGLLKSQHDFFVGLQLLSPLNTGSFLAIADGRWSPTTSGGHHMGAVGEESRGTSVPIAVCLRILLADECGLPATCCLTGLLQDPMPACR